MPWESLFVFDGFDIFDVYRILNEIHDYMIWFGFFLSDQRGFLSIVVTDRFYVVDS